MNNYETKCILPINCAECHSFAGEETEFGLELYCELSDVVIDDRELPEFCPLKPYAYKKEEI